MYSYVLDKCRLWTDFGNGSNILLTHLYYCCWPYLILMRIGATVHQMEGVIDFAGSTILI